MQGDHRASQASVFCANHYGYHNFPEVLVLVARRQRDSSSKYRGIGINERINYFLTLMERKTLSERQLHICLGWRRVARQDGNSIKQCAASVHSSKPNALIACQPSEGLGWQKRALNTRGRLRFAAHGARGNESHDQRAWLDASARVVTKSEPVHGFATDFQRGCVCAEQQRQYCTVHSGRVCYSKH